MMLEEITQRDSLPYPVGLHRIVCYGDYGLYLIGGATYTGSMPPCSSNNIYNAQLYKFNLSTKKWTALAPVVPKLSDEHAAVVNVKVQPDKLNIVLVSRCTGFLDRRRLMIAGGRLLNSDFNIASYSTYIYDVDTQSTMELSAIERANDGDMLQLPTGHRDFFDQIFLKWNNSYLVVSRIMDDVTGRKRFVFHLLVWQETPDGRPIIRWDDISARTTPGGAPIDEPIGGDLCELAVNGDYVYCIDKNDIENCLDVQWRYDLRARRWEPVDSSPDLTVSVSSSMFARGKPVDRMFTCSVVYGDSVYIVGGSAMIWAGPKSNPVLADIWKFHMPTQKWSLMPVRLPQGLWFHSVDVSPSGFMYIFGGFTDLAGRKPTRNIWRIFLETPPPLSLLSWHMVLQMSRFNLEERTDDELRDLRVPQCFVSALRW